MHHCHRRAIIPLVLGTALSIPSLAATPADETITIVASPVIEANRVDNQGSLSTVVTETQIRDLTAVDVPAALRRTPGVTISRFNPVGSFGGDEGGSVNIRGLGASRPGAEIKTYVDGVPFYMGVWSHPLMDLLPLNGMAEVAVHKAPQPQRFGNNFGAIELSPRTARQATPTANGRVSAGSFGTIIEQADLSGKLGPFDYSLAQGYARSDGHREAADGELVNMLASGTWHLNEMVSLGITVLHMDNSASDPGQEGQPATRTGRYDTQGTLAVATLAAATDLVQGSLKIYGNTGDGDWYQQPGLDGDTLTRFTMAGVRWSQSLTPWQGGEILFGLDYDTVTGEVDFNRIAPAPQARFNGPTLQLVSPHLAVSHTIELGAGWTLVPSAGFRHYEHNVFKSATAPHAGVLLRSEKLEFRGNVARGLTFAGIDAAVLSSLIPPLGDSWKQLKPEQMDHIEFGASYRPWATTTLDLALFRDSLEDRYLFGFPPAVSAPSFVNLGKYRSQGMEASLQQAITDPWTAFIGVTWLDPSLENLPYAPRETLVIGTNARYGRWRLSLDGQYQAEMYVLNRARAAGALNTAQVDSFPVLNGRVGYALPTLGPRGEIFVAVENLFDRDYEFRPGYPMPGASAQAGINVSF